MARSLGAWTRETTGTGAISVAGFKATMSTTSSAPADSRAYLRRYVRVPPGSVVEMRAMCRIISGVGGMRIDLEGLGNVIRKDVSNADLQEITCSVVVPFSDADDVSVACNVGTFADDIKPSSIEVFDPRVYVDGIEISLIPLVARRAGSGKTLSVQFTNGDMTQRGVRVAGQCNTAWGSIFTTGVVNVPEFTWPWVGEWDWDGYVTSGTGSTASSYRNNDQIGGIRGVASTETFSVYVVARGRWY